MDFVNAFCKYIKKKVTPPPLISYEEYNNNIIRQVLKREAKPTTYASDRRCKNCGTKIVQVRGHGHNRGHSTSYHTRHFR